MKLLMVILFILSFIYAPSALAEYNPTTNKNEFLLISDESEVNMGRSVSKTVEKEFDIINDPKLNEKINTIGDKLVSVCDRKDIHYRFSILKDKKNKETINAFTIPGGYIYIFKDLIDKTASDDEIAGVLAHEIGHTAARHVVKRLQAGIGLSAIQILMGVTGAIKDSRSAALSNLAMVELMTAYSRDDELLADRLAIKYMRKAGYNPNGMVIFLEKLQKINRDQPIKPKSFIRTHPYLDDRIRQARQEATGKITFKDYINRGVDLP